MAKNNRCIFALSFEGGREVELRMAAPDRKLTAQETTERSLKVWDIGKNGNVDANWGNNVHVEVDLLK